MSERQLYRREGEEGREEGEEGEEGWEGEEKGEEGEEGEEEEERVKEDPSGRMNKHQEASTLFLPSPSSDPPCFWLTI